MFHVKHYIFIVLKQKKINKSKNYLWLIYLSRDIIGIKSE